MTPSDPVGLGQAEPGSGLVSLREPSWAHTDSDTHAVTPSGAEHCHYLSLWRIVRFCASV